MNGPGVMTVPLPPEGHDGALCGAKKRQSEGTCTQVAGWGTDHVGDGPCKLHGGNTKAHRSAADVRQVETGARRALADLGVTTPVTDPLLELQRLAGEIISFKDALRAMVERLNSVRYDGPVGEQIRGEIVVYERAMDRAARVLRDMASLKIDERIVEIRSRITEQQGSLVAGVIRAILDDLDLTSAQQARAREVAPRRLRELAQGGSAAVRRFEDGSRRLTLADFDRELELLRAERGALPAPGPFVPRMQSGEADDD